MDQVRFEVVGKLNTLTRRHVLHVIADCGNYCVKFRHFLL
jgi:hypothetical protein